MKQQKIRFSLECGHCDHMGHSDVVIDDVPKNSLPYLVESGYKIKVGCSSCKAIRSLWIDESVLSDMKQDPSQVLTWSPFFTEKYSILMQVTARVLV
jgi:hypothetical protein